MKLVMVTWFDAYGCPKPWTSLKVQRGEARVDSIGWVIGEDKKYLYLCADVDSGIKTIEDDTIVGRFFAIPKACIVKVRRI